MKVGVALPQMAPGFNRARMLDWCRGIDEGPYSSISAGERITFFNAEMITLLSAAAVLTERVEVLANVCVSPWHRPALLAKQFTTIDVLSGGRLTVALGVGGRQQDYDALDVPFARRHQRVDDDAAELRRLWSGGTVADGPIGPSPVQPGGPALLCSSLGPKSMARAARWASGVSGFAITGRADEAARLFTLADEAWSAAGRTDRPRRTCGAFVVAGVDDELATLRAFARDYLGFMGDEFAELLAGMQSVAGQAAVAGMLSEMEAAWHRRGDSRPRFLRPPLPRRPDRSGRRPITRPGPAQLAPALPCPPRCFLDSHHAVSRISFSPFSGLAAIRFPAFSADWGLRWRSTRRSVAAIRSTDIVAVAYRPGQAFARCRPARGMTGSVSTRLGQ